MRIIILFILAIIFPFLSFAAIINGHITDEKTGEAIIGATIAIKGTTNGTVSDYDGNFSLSTQSGKYIIVVKYIGYEAKEIANVTVNESKTTVLNIALAESKSTQIEEFVVRAAIKKESINALYSLQKNAATISDGISADIIKKSPDRSTGEVLKRISGTTIQDNKYVIIRGLSDRYNTALIDNAVLPSTEPNRKAFSFDIIPAAMIDNIIISKAGTPDLPGDFAGGVINILTKEAPDKNYNSLSLGLSYNTASTFQKFKSGYRSSTDILGFDNGARQLPKHFPSSVAIQAGQVTQQQGVLALNSLNNNYSIKEQAALPGVNIQGVLGRVIHTKNNNKIGITAAATYAHSELIKNNLLRQYDNYDFVDNVYTYATNIGAMLNAGYFFGGNKIVFKTLYNRVFDDNFLYREGYNFSSNAHVRYYAFDLVQKSLFKTSLEGEHRIGKKEGKLGWLLAYNNVKNNQPDQRKVSYAKGPGASVYSADNTTLGKSNNRLFSDLNEHIFNANFFYTQPFTVANMKSALKIGAFVLLRNRSFNNRYIGAVLDPNNSNESNIRTRPLETLYAPDVLTSGAYYLNDITLADDVYTANATTTAGYAMVDNNIIDKLRIVWGIRVESHHLDLKSGGGQVVQPTWNDVLPSANLTYNLTSKSNIRASYFRSIARPELREVAPISYYDYELNAITSGNTNLVRSQINNIDLRYELYPNVGEILSFSVFYKGFNNTIENKIDASGSGYLIATANFKNARNIGVEMELRKTLGFISDNRLFNNLNIYLNLAYINSVVKLETPIHINGKEFNNRPLSGQSPYVINASLGYSAFNNKLNLNILYNRIGQRLFLVGGNDKGNVYESPRNLLDVQASYAINKHCSVKFNIKDLLNSPTNFYFDQDNNGKFERQDVSDGNISSVKDWIYQQYKTGTNFSFTFSYNF